jgi:hypothetical protein
MNTFMDDDYDLNRIIVRPLYFGLLINIVIPIGLLFLCYYYNQHNAPLPNRVGDAGDTLLYLFIAVAAVEVLMVVLWRNKLFATPMIRSKETFEKDFSDEYLKRSRPLFVVIASLSIYGYVYFYLTGMFNQAAWFVVGSFLVFQLVRPRHGLLRKLLDRQKKLVESGEFLR